MPASRALSEYGDKDNSDLAERFKISTDDFPQYRLWTKGKDSTKEPVKFTAAKKSEEFMKFIQTNAGVWVGLPGQVKELDALAKEFGSAKDKAPSPHPALHFSPAPQAPASAPSSSLGPSRGLGLSLGLRLRLRVPSNSRLPPSRLRSLPRPRSSRWTRRTPSPPSTTRRRAARRPPPAARQPPRELSPPACRSLHGRALCSLGRP